MDQQEKNKLIRCSACGKPLAAIHGQDVHVRKNSGGGLAEVIISTQYEGGGRTDIKCSCGNSNFSIVKLALPMRYVVAQPKK